MSIVYHRLISHQDMRWNILPRVNLIRPIEEGRIKTTGTIEEILNNFDFSVTRAALISPTEGLVDEHFMEDEANGRLRIMNIHCPISSLLRSIKYCKKGYWLTSLEACKLFVDWEARDSDYRRNIIDTLTRINSENKPTQQELNELYRLMRID
jgi:hypothetical protein